MFYELQMFAKKFPCNTLATSYMDFDDSYYNGYNGIFSLRKKTFGIESVNRELRAVIQNSYNEEQLEMSVVYHCFK